MNIGDNIRRIRQKKGLSQKQLGELLHMSPIMISQYENGKRNPKLETIQKIAKALETTPGYLMNISEPQEKNNFNYLDFVSDASIGFEITGRSLQHSPEVYSTLLSWVKDIFGNDSTLYSKKGKNDFKTLYELLSSPDTSYEEKATLLNSLIDFVICDPDTKKLQIFIDTEVRDQSLQHQRLSQLFTTLNNTGINRVLEYATALSSLPSYQKKLTSIESIEKCSFTSHTCTNVEQTPENMQYDSGIMDDNKNLE